MLRDQIKACSTPEEAFLLLADAIDMLRYDVEHAHEEGSPFEKPLQWGDAPTFATADPILKTPAMDLDAISKVRAALETCTDDEERKVLNARLYLLKNPGRVPPANVVEGTRPGQDGDDVVLVPPTEERMDKRRNFARNLTLWTFLDPGMDEETVVEAFAKGGPLWLYDGGAYDAIMQMPVSARQWMCEDLAVDSQAQALEMARDILKSAEGIQPADAIEYHERVVNAR